jgi:hypothetical protein
MDRDQRTNNRGVAKTSAVPRVRSVMMFFKKK